MKKVFSLLTTFAMLISTVVVPTAVSAEDTTYWTDEGIVATAFAGGSGTETDPYEIATAAQLAKLAADANTEDITESGDVCEDTYYELTADIDLSGHDWVPIANSESRFFSGKILGNGHVITNMTITCSHPVIGFIGSGYDDTAVSDLGFENANISYKNNRYSDGTMDSTSSIRCYSAGTVIAYVRGGTYTNVYVRNSVIENKQADTSEQVTGGFAGQGMCQGTYGDSKSTRRVATFTNCYVVNTTVKGGNSAVHSGFMGRFYPGSGGNKRVRTEFVNCYTADLTMTSSSDLAFMYFNFTSDLGNMYSASNVYATNTNTFTQMTEIATIGASKSDIVTAMTTADGGMVADRGNINNGYPVCKWEADWLWNGTAAEAFAGGTGTEKDPYLIANGEQLALLANNVYNAVSTTTAIPVAETSTTEMYNAYTGTYFKLTADIDLGGEDWKPIGRYGMRFNGVFDGDGHVISNLNIDTLYHGLGLFGATGKDVVIKNVGIENADIVYANNTTSVADYNASGDISFTVTAGRGIAAGALIGIIGGGTVENCYVKNAAVKNTNYTTCAENGGTGALIGVGISTENHDSNSSNRTYITNCYAVDVAIQSGQAAGALAGRSGMGNVKPRCSFIFANCYVGGESSVTVKSNAYNIVSYADGANGIPAVNNCYTTAITATSSTNEIIETTINNKTAELVTKDKLISGIVDFDAYYPDNYSSNINGGYPVLEWQKTWEDADAFEGFAFADISTEGIREVTANLTLPETKVVDGYTHNLTWTSSDTDVVAVDGTVTPKIGDTDVTLTVRSTNTGSSKTFEITVLGELTKAFNAGLGGEDRYAITKNITLPETVTAGGTSYDVDWRTSELNVVASDGTIGKVLKNTPVCLTAYVNSEVYIYNVAVCEQVTGKTVYIDESFESFGLGTDISRADGWTNPVGTGVKGVNYTIEKDPTNEDNNVIKVERYYGRNNGASTWYLNGVAQEGSGPSRDEAAMVVLDSDPDTDGNQPVTDGKIQFKARMMFETGESQRMAIWFNNVNGGRDNSCIEIQYGTGGKAWTKFSGEDNPYASIGAEAKYEWYDVRVVLDLDESTYFISVTREDGITYTQKAPIVDGANKSIASIGIHSRTADDCVGAETKTSVWYVDDLSITDITVTDTEAVAYAKDKLSLQSTATEDLILPATGEEATKITWSTNNAAVITADGVVSFARESKTAILTATITKGDATDTKEFVVTVPGKDAYEIKGIVVTTADSTGKELVGGGEITAVEILNNFSEAGKMYVALYDNGRFVTVSTADLDADSQSKDVREVTLDTAITLPSDITGYEAKVFIWNEMQPLAEAYSSNIPNTTLWMLGDSIMTYYSAGSYPMTGWGMVVGDRLSERVTVENRAHGGYTTDTYLTDTKLDALSSFVEKIEPGDYAVIGLGINDSNDKNNISVEQYEANYRNIAQQIINQGATPILTTTTITAYAGDNEPNLSRYSAQKEVVKKVAGDMGLVCIDISSEMAKRFNDELTAGATMEDIRDKYYVWDLAENGWDLSTSTMQPNLRDGTHINVNGANLVADIFADLLQVSASKLGLYVK